jgi:hypothetical protein
MRPVARYAGAAIGGILSSSPAPLAARIPHHAHRHGPGGGARRRDGRVLVGFLYFRFATRLN